MDIQLYRLDRLLDKWKDRFACCPCYNDYAIAVNKCIDELQSLVDACRAENEWFKDMLSHLPSETAEYNLLCEEADKEHKVEFQLTT